MVTAGRGAATEGGGGRRPAAAGGAAAGPSWARRPCQYAASPCLIVLRPRAGLSSRSIGAPALAGRRLGQALLPGAAGCWWRLLIPAGSARVPAADHAPGPQAAPLTRLLCPLRPTPGQEAGAGVQRRLGARAPAQQASHPPWATQGMPGLCASFQPGRHPRRHGAHSAAQSHRAARPRPLPLAPPARPQQAAAPHTSPGLAGESHHV